jgi:uncharacterized protein (TIGR03067 family)
MKRIACSLAAFALLFCASAGPKGKGAPADATADRAKIHGTWRFVSVLDQGNEHPMPEANRLVITADVMKVVYPKDDPMGWKYSIDPSKDPKEMDWVVEEDPGHPIRQLAIYSLDGDTLRIRSTAAGKPRPTKFESRKGDFGGVWVLKRVAPASTGKAAN